jgi:hypothetical protein
VTKQFSAHSLMVALPYAMIAQKVEPGHPGSWVLVLGRTGSARQALFLMLWCMRRTLSVRAGAVIDGRHTVSALSSLLHFD